MAARFKTPPPMLPPRRPYPSQNRVKTLIGSQTNGITWIHCHENVRAALPQIRVETLIDSQANYEIKIKITIYFYKIMKSYEKYSTKHSHKSK